MQLRNLREQDCRAAMAAGDFLPDVTRAASRVAIVLTQSWCPQWGWMRSYLEALPDGPGTAVFFLEYDREPFFEEFMAFKEERLGNDQVPYVRYYRDGLFTRGSNFIDRAGFLRFLDAP